jgi:hypothetical protein
MEFIYPFFTEDTHKINVDNATNLVDYPLINNSSAKTYNLLKDTPICLIRYGVGAKAQWSLIRVVNKEYQYDEYYNKDFYVRTADIKGIDVNKKYLSINNSKENLIDPEAREIIEETRDAFIPYADQRNGLYSVKVEMEYEKFLDNLVFLNSLQKAYREGIRILLESRGFRSDDGFIDYLQENYYNFAYVNKTHDILSIRACVPVRFTVSIPLVFIGKQNEEANFPDAQQDEIDKTKITKVLNLSKQGLISTSEQIMNALLARMTQVEDLTKPLKFLDNFLIDYEVNNISKFVATFYELLTKVDLPPTNSVSQQYIIGLSDELDIISIEIIQKMDNETKVYIVPKSVLEQFKFSKDSFTSKRILNYFLNAENMFKDSYDSNIKILEFIGRYVKYPEPRLVDSIEISPKLTLPADTAKKYNDFFKQQQECTTITLKDVIVNDPVYQIFVASTRNKVDGQNASWGETIEEAIKVMNNVNKDDEDEENVVSVAWTSVVNALQGASGVSDARIAAPLLTTKGKQIGGVRRAFIIALQILERINIVKVLIEYIICELIKGDANDKKTAEYIKKYLTPQTIAYLLKLLTNDINYKDMLYKITNGLPFDIDLFCVKNKELAYFLKAIMTGNLYIPGSEGGAQTEEFKIFDFSNGIVDVNIMNPVKQKIKNFKDLRKTNSQKNNKLYRKLLGDILSNIFGVLANRLVSYLQEYLLAPCAEDEYAFPGENVLNTVNTAGDNKTKDNVFDSAKIDLRNRTAASSAIPIRYDAEPEGAVDLLKKLLEDISCVLTPIEICDAMEDNFSQEAMMLIKGIIRRRYLPDFEELLSESNIRLLFTTLGKTVDPQVCKNIKNSIVDTIKNITNTLSNDSNVINALAIECNPIIAGPRKAILADKGDNDIIEQARLKNSRVNDRINKLTGNDLAKPIELSLFCSDNDGNIDPRIDEGFRNNIRQIIDNFKDRFNQEATESVENFITSVNQQMKQADKTVGTLEYKVLYADLKRNVAFSNPATYYNNINEKLTYRFKNGVDKGEFEALITDLIAKGAAGEEAQKCIETPKIDFTKILASVANIPLFLGTKQYSVNSYNQDEKDFIALNEGESKNNSLFFSGMFSYTNYPEADKKLSTYSLNTLNKIKNRWISNNDFSNIYYKEDKSRTFTDRNSGPSICDQIFDYWVKNNLEPIDEMQYIGILAQELGLIDDTSDWKIRDLSFVGEDEVRKSYMTKYELRQFRRDNDYFFFYFYDGDFEVNNDRLTLALVLIDKINESFKTIKITRASVPDQVKGTDDIFDTGEDVFDWGYESNRVIPDGAELSYEFGDEIDIRLIRQKTEIKNTLDDYTKCPLWSCFHLLESNKNNSFDLYRSKVMSYVHDNYLNFVKSLQPFAEEKEKIANISKSFEFLMKFKNFPLFDVNVSSSNNLYDTSGVNMFSNLNRPVYSDDPEIISEPIFPYYNEYILNKSQEDYVLNSLNKTLNSNGKADFNDLFIYLKQRSTEKNVQKYEINKYKLLDYYSSGADKNVDVLNDIRRSYELSLMNTFLCNPYDLENGLLNIKDLGDIVNVTENIKYDVSTGKSKKVFDGTSENMPSDTIKFIEENNRLVSIFRKINLNLTQTLQEETCKVFPHYFNDKAWIGEFDKSLKAQICEGNPAAFPQESIYVIIKILFRTYVAEIMSRATYKFVYYSKQDIEELLSDTNFKSIIRTQFFKELNELVKQDSFQELFTISIKKYYSKLEEEYNLNGSGEKLDQKYVEKKDVENKEINYFITKEIIYYFTIINKIVSEMKYSSIKEYKEFIKYLNSNTRFVNTVVYDETDFNTITDYYDISNKIKKNDVPKLTMVRTIERLNTEELAQAQTILKNSFGRTEINGDSLDIIIPDANEIRKMTIRIIFANVDNEEIYDLYNKSYLVNVTDPATATFKLIEAINFAKLLGAKLEGPLANLEIITEVNAQMPVILQKFLNSEEYKILVELGGFRLYNLMGIEYLLNSSNFGDRTSLNFKVIKYDILKLFVKYSKILVDNISEDAERVTFESLLSKTLTSEIFKDVDRTYLNHFLSKISKSNNPISLIQKNVSISTDGGMKLLKNMSESSLKITKIAVESNDLASRLASTYDKFTTLAVQLPWFLSRNDTERKQDIATASEPTAKMLARVYTGRPILPETFFLLASLFSAPFTGSTVIWATSDLLLESIGWADFYKEYDELRKFRNPKLDICETDPDAAAKVIDATSCTLEKEQQLEDSYKQLEYNTPSYLENIK